MRFICEGKSYPLFTGKFVKDWLAMQDAIQLRLWKLCGDISKDERGLSSAAICRHLPIEVQTRDFMEFMPTQRQASLLKVMFHDRRTEEGS